MKKVIFCDIDGTIVDSTRGLFSPTEKTKYAFNELLRDNYVFIASGRCYALLPEDIINLNPSGFVLCNGAYVNFNSKEIFTRYFNDVAINKIKEVSDKYQGFYILEEVNKLHISAHNNQAFKDFTNGWGFDFSEYCDNDVSGNNVSIAMIGFDSTVKMNLAAEELKPYVSLAQHRNITSFDLNVLNITKAVGVKKILEYLNIDVKNAYGFGDGVNDLEMLQEVGNPVIMKNADSRLFKYNFEMTADVLEDGFYHYLVNNNIINAM